MAGIGGGISHASAASVSHAQDDDFHRPVAEAGQGKKEQSRAGPIPANGDGAWFHHGSQIMAKAIMRADGTPQARCPNGYIEKPVFTSTDRPIRRRGEILLSGFNLLPLPSGEGIWPRKADGAAGMS
jgi:hypothetical protein